MLIFLILLVLLGGGIVLSIGSLWGDWLELAGFLLIATAVVGLVIATVALVVEPMEVRATICAYYSLKETIEVARDNPDPIERAALAQKIADMNMQITTLKYYNSTLWANIFIPDEVMVLEPLR